MCDQKKSITELRAELEQHNALYYTHAQPEISDAQYDRLFRELENLEKKYPEYADENSPTQRIGGSPIEGFEPVQHTVPMLSIDDVFSEKEVEDFFDRVKKSLIKTAYAQSTEFLIEPKIDGVAISLFYRDGKLTHAATRGDGRRGDNITANARTIRSIPLKLPDTAPGLLEIRGEVYMTNTAFAKMNAQRDADGLPTFANPRNSTAGTLKQLDPRAVAARPLRFIAHGIAIVSNSSTEDGQPPEPVIDPDIVATESDLQELLDSLGIPRNQPCWTANTIEEIFSAIEKLDQIRHDFDHSTDGAVIKLADYAARNHLGNTARAPRWSAAFKYPPEAKPTRLLDITVQVGRTGILTPVAELAPVVLSGTTVRRASLHNQSFIDHLRAAEGSEKNSSPKIVGLRLGDTVTVHKAGEIIPEILNIDLTHRPPTAQPFDLASHINHACPACGKKITREENKTRREGEDYTIVTHRCTNSTCPAQLATLLVHFASRAALDIEGLDTAVAEKLIEKMSIDNPMNLFDLDEKKLANLTLDPASLGEGKKSKPRRLGERKAALIINSLQTAKQKPLHNWLIALGISQVGVTVARDIASHHRDIFDLAKSNILPAIVRLAQLRSELDESKSTVRNKKTIQPDLLFSEKNQQPDFAKSKKTTEQLEAEIIKTAAPLIERGIATKSQKKNAKSYDFITTIGPAASAAVVNFFASKAGEQLIAHCRNLGIDAQSEYFIDPAAEPENAEALPLSGKTFVITGTLEQPRDYYRDLIVSAGGRVSSAVSKNTDYLLAGASAGSKLDKAQKLGVAVIDAEGLAELMAQS